LFDEFTSAIRLEYSLSTTVKCNLGPEHFFKGFKFQSQIDARPYLFVDRIAQPPHQFLHKNFCISRQIASIVIDGLKHGIKKITPPDHTMKKDVKGKGLMKTYLLKEKLMC
jgi:hypothetical protein